MVTYIPWGTACICTHPAGTSVEATRVSEVVEAALKDFGNAAKYVEIRSTNKISSQFLGKKWLGQ